MATSTGKSSTNHSYRARVIKFKISRYIIRSLLWLLVLYLALRLGTKLLYPIMINIPNTSFAMLLTIRWVLMGLFLLIRILGIVRKLLSRLYLYDDKIVYDRPRIGSFRTVIPMSEVELEDGGVSWSQKGLQRLCNCFTVMVTTKKNKKFKFKDIIFGEHVFNYICKQASPTA